MERLACATSRACSTCAKPTFRNSFPCCARLDWCATSASIALIAARRLQRYQVAEWLWESWKFVKQIAPLLLIGVFLAGAARAIVPQELIQSLAGENSLSANASAVAFGVLMYFPTLVYVGLVAVFCTIAGYLFGAFQSLP